MQLTDSCPSMGEGVDCADGTKEKDPGSKRNYLIIPAYCLYTPESQYLK